MPDTRSASLSTFAAVALANFLAGCGMTSAPNVTRDAASGTSDTFACDTAACRSTEVCVHPACGCVVFVRSPNDAGACADGTSFEEALDGCVPNCQPAYCVTPDPADPHDCTGDDGSFSGTIDGVPDAAGVVCYEWCL